MGIIEKPLKGFIELPFKIGVGAAFPPVRVNFTLCYRCNLNCRHCLQRGEFRKMRGSGLQELTASEVASVVRQTLPGLTRIGLCGGEIFLHPEIMEILASTARRNPVGFTTNGALIDSNRAKEIVRLGIRGILFSIDGTEAAHDSIRGVPGTFRKAIEAIRLLDSWKRSLERPYPEISINTVIMGDNVDSLKELVEVAPEIGVRTVEVQMMDMQAYRFTSAPDQSILYTAPAPVPPVPRDLAKAIREVFDRAAQLKVTMRLKPESAPDTFAAYYANRMDLSGYSCSFPWKNIIISPYGDVYPCYMISMGNVREQSLAKIWNGATFRNFRRVLSKARLFPGCAGCCFMSRTNPVRSGT